jgi:hypothetical protein
MSVRWVADRVRALDMSARRLVHYNPAAALSIFLVGTSTAVGVAWRHASIFSFYLFSFSVVRREMRAECATMAGLLTAIFVPPLRKRLGFETKYPPAPRTPPPFALRG